MKTKCKSCGRQVLLAWRRPASCFILGSLSKDAVYESENVIWKCDLRFCNHFSIIQTRFAWKMCSNYPGIKLEPALGTWEDKIEHLSSYAHVVHTTANQVISRRRKNENVFKMSKDEKCTCKACKNTVFIVKYANLWGFCCRRRRGCLSSLISHVVERHQNVRYERPTRTP